MRAILALLLLSPLAHADTATDVRVRVALALAAQASHKEPAPALVIPVPTAPAALTYADAFTKATAERKPLVVFIGEPEIPIRSYEAVWVSCRDDSLAATPQVWVGIVQTSTGTMFRSVLDGTPAEADIKAAAHKLDKELNVPKPVQAVQQAGWSNVGSCPCQAATGRCTCLPASKCPGGCPAQFAPAQSQPTAPVTLPPSYFRSSMGSFALPCST